MKQNRETEEWNAVLLELGFRPEEAEAVSYTHLDVYKRQ